MKKHATAKAETCPNCKPKFDAADDKTRKQIERHHKYSLNRGVREEALRDMGLKKVRGSVSGKIYWE